LTAKRAVIATKAKTVVTRARFIKISSWLSMPRLRFGYKRKDVAAVMAGRGVEIRDSKVQVEPVARNLPGSTLPRSPRRASFWCSPRKEFTLLLSRLAGRYTKRS
jgi:hypothetical protein